MRGRPISSEGEPRAIACPQAIRLALAAGGVLLASGIVGLADGSPATGATCPATASVLGKTLPRLFPPLEHGDRNFAGHGPAVTVAAKRKHITNGTDSLTVTVRMRAQETTSDWTRAAGERTFTLYTAPSGCHIVFGSARLGPFDSNGYLNRAGITSDPFSLTAGDTDTLNPSFVRRYTVWDDHSGDDVTSYTSVRVLTRTFSVRLQD